MKKFGTGHNRQKIGSSLFCVGVIRAKILSDANYAIWIERNS